MPNHFLILHHTQLSIRIIQSRKRFLNRIYKSSHYPQDYGTSPARKANQNQNKHQSRENGQNPENGFRVWLPETALATNIWDSPGLTEA